MSLRDALLAKGVVNQKDVARVNRALKDERRAEQGARRAQTEVEREEAARLAAEQEAAAAERRRERDVREARRAALELRLRIENVIRTNAARPGKGQPFWHKALGGATIGRLDVSSGVAYQLRCGEAGIAADLRHDEVEYVILPAKAIHKLRALAPERVVFFVDDTTGISEPDHRFLAREWDSDLIPRRATDADLSRFTQG